MCSGKTTVGRLLAERLGWTFLDVDEEVERREGMSIPEIFSRKGEGYFRKKELEILKELCRREEAVISTGGGLGANPEAMEIMRERGLVVWLKVSFEDFLRRCSKEEGRPLLSLGEEKLKELLREREEVYSRAHLKVEGEDPHRTVDRIVSELDQST